MEKKRISLCPDVDVNDESLANDKLIRENLSKSNHLTGVISPFIMSNFNFNDQYYTYNSYNNIDNLHSFLPNSIDSIYNTINNSKKQRLKLKETRQKYNNPGTGDFNGPWAKYKDQNMFKNISNGNELTEEQKDILAQMEEKRLKKIEDQKKQDEGYLSFKPFR